VPLPVGSEVSWRFLRLTRAQPPGAATRGFRPRTFGAALEQSEQLREASAAVGAAARPIVLFYGLTQAARAISAASRTGAADAPARHGLTLLNPAFHERSMPTLEQIYVRDQGRGFLQHVAGLVASPTVPLDTSVAALLRSLPRYRDLLLGDRPESAPLAIAEGDTGHRNEVTKHISLRLGPLPAHLVRSRPEGGLTLMIPPTGDEVGEWLGAYPRLAPLGAAARVENVWPGQRNDEWTIQATWPLDSPLDMPARMRWCVNRMDRPDPPYRDGIPMSGIVLPGLGGNAAALHPLITWWAVLFAFSMLARYYPRIWSDLLDVDRNPHAVPTASALESAQSVVPSLVVEALAGIYRGDIAAEPV
jgi:hypothetical protein